MRRLEWVVACLLVCGACAEDAADSELGFSTGPLMRPGDNCLRCHRAQNTEYPSAPDWSAAGTVFPGPDSPTSDGVPDVRVILSDADGDEIETLVTNRAGNFYTDTELPTGFRVALEYEGERIDMPCAPPAGNCGACHSDPPIGGAPGRIFLPQAPEADAISDSCQGFQ
jgi:hypothetical protein